MAANKFATMLHSNTNRTTLLLIYALLEWTLILLLLLNSLFSFLIFQFSQFFALIPPCLWCSTLHPFFHSNPPRPLLCHSHSKEVSVLGFCPNHKKLAQIKDFCQGCFSSHLRFQSHVVKHSDQEHEDGHNLMCSCCGLEFQKQKIDDLLQSKDFCNVLESRMNDDVKKSISVETETCLNQERGDSSSACDFLPQDLEFFFDFSGNQLVPIELIDSTTDESQNVSEAADDDEFGEFQNAQEHHTTPRVDSVDIEETESTLVFLANFGRFEEESAIVETPASLLQELHQKTTIETKEFQLNDHLVDEETKTPSVLKSCVEEESSTDSSDLHLKIENNGLESKNLSGIRTEDEVEKIPNSPASFKKFFMFERKDSLDGSLTSELEGGDLVNTTEKLKSAISALKAELEEERSASAVAASETMAMITRLQEEKAAMQMEALQYQRMMEEQSEYDQEALQLLNELMIKKEKELEMYRKKVADYEVKERNSDSSDEWNNNNVDDSGGVVELDSSLADFEEERLSIFEQIKALEGKLFSLSDEEDQQFTDVRAVEDLYADNGFHSNELVTESMGYDSGELENARKRMEMEEEVDQVYERLKALETDREFLKHCIGSLKKGEKGIEILQEILQHLRDLRTIDFQI